MHPRLNLNVIRHYKKEASCQDATLHDLELIARHINLASSKINNFKPFIIMDLLTWTESPQGSDFWGQLYSGNLEQLRGWKW